ncbi:MAG: response regulator, partial [Candidatus Cybelea sp.]
MDVAGQRPRVLVIDDERGLRELLEYGLARAGFAVRSVTEGSAALGLLSSWPPDVIVLDVMLPGGDGFTLLPEIRRLTTAPVVMLSARTEVADRVAGLSAGADDYV